MTKVSGTLKERLATLFKEEKTRHEQKRKELADERDRLKYQLEQVEMQLLQMDKDLQSQINQSLKEAGLDLEPQPAARSRGGEIVRRQRGSNREWIIQQVGQRGPMTRGEMLTLAEKAGLKPSSISHTLYALVKTGHLEPTGEEEGGTSYQVAAHSA